MRPLDASELLLDHHRCDPLMVGLEPLHERATKPVLVGTESLKIRVVTVGRRDEVEQVDVPATSGARDVGRDRRGDGAGCPGDDDHGVRTERDRRPLVRGRGWQRTLDQADGPAAVVHQTDLDRTAVAQRLGDQLVGVRGGLPVDRQVDGFHQRVGPLAMERLGESADATAHRRPSTHVVIAMATTETGGRDEERPLATHAVAEATHERVETGHATAQRLTPAFEVGGAQIDLDVQGRQPVDPGDPVGRERGSLVGDLLGRGTRGHGVHSRTLGLEPTDECRADSTFVEPDHDARTVEGDAGRQAPVEGRAQHRGRAATRDGRGRFVVPDDEAAGSRGHGWRWGHRARRVSSCLQARVRRAGSVPCRARTR